MPWLVVFARCSLCHRGAEVASEDDVAKVYSTHFMACVGSNEDQAKFRIDLVLAAQSAIKERGE